MHCPASPKVSPPTAVGTGCRVWGLGCWDDPRFRVKALRVMGFRVCYRVKALRVGGFRVCYGVRRAEGVRW